MNAILNHRSIRKFTNQEIEQEMFDQMVLSATRGSNTGNMQLYSIVITTSQDVKDKLAPLHFNQPCAKSAAAIVTFCADINRFSKWCNQRDAEPGYDNLQWFVTATIDTTIAAQNFAIAAEEQGLGVCYLGTTTYNGSEISDVLNLPKGVIPVTTLVVGYPDQEVELTDRLPQKAVVHYDTYSDYDEAKIDELWAEKEASEVTKSLIEVNEGCDNLAQIFTKKRYTKENNIVFSKKLRDTLKKQGFLE